MKLNRTETSTEASTDTKPKAMEFIPQWHGLTDYNNALELQESTHQSISNDKSSPTILGFEHPKVITLGIRGKEDEDLSQTEEDLKKNGFQIVQIRRGGQAVLHNRGQLVIYPIIPIRRLGISVKCYVDLLEKTTMSFLGSFDISTKSGTKDPQRQMEPGLYTEHGKIAFFGIQVKNGSTLHGVAINVKNNLDEFNAIRSCGVSNQKLDRVFNHLRRLDSEAEALPEFKLENLFEKWCQEFSRHLNDFITNNQSCS